MAIYAWVGQDNKLGVVTGQPYKKAIFYTRSYVVAMRILGTGRKVYKANTWAKLAELMKDVPLDFPIFHWVSSNDIGLDYFRKARYDYHNHKKGFIE